MFLEKVLPNINHKNFKN